MGRTGLCVCPSFLSREHLSTTRKDLEDQRSAGLFHRAGSGKFTAHQNSDQVRRDEVLWLDRPAANPAQLFLWRRMDRLMQALNRKLYLGIRKFDGHYAVYPTGGFYRRHLDRFRGDPSRVVSFILYLNSNWQDLDGGRLRIYRQSTGHLDVDPVGGTMVCFLSGESEHEVLVSQQDRFSFSGWFCT